MVHHIVMWKFKPEIAEEQKPELKRAMKENLDCLPQNLSKSRSRPALMTWLS